MEAVNFSTKVHKSKGEGISKDSERPQIIKSNGLFLWKICKTTKQVYEIKKIRDFKQCRTLKDQDGIKNRKLRNKYLNPCPVFCQFILLFRILLVLLVRTLWSMWHGTVSLRDQGLYLQHRLQCFHFIHWTTISPRSKYIFLFISLFQILRQVFLCPFPITFFANFVFLVPPWSFWEATIPMSFHEFLCHLVVFR